MPYDDLGPRTVTATLSSDNSGNWAAVFTPAIIQSRLPLIEVYHIYLEGPPGATFQVLRNTDKWGASPNGFRNEWDPAQPLPLRSGDTLAFNFSTNVAPAPQVTIWLRTENR